MDENRAGGYVNKLIFNNDYELNINCNDIVVFVGPNNVGKSRALRDISTISAQPFPGIIIKDLEIKKYGGSVSNLLNRLQLPVVLVWLTYMIRLMVDLASIQLLIMIFSITSTLAVSISCLFHILKLPNVF